MIKKHLVIPAALVLLLAPAVSSALTNDGIRAQVASLLAQVHALQERLQLSMVQHPHPAQAMAQHLPPAHIFLVSSSRTTSVPMTSTRRRTEKSPSSNGFLPRTLRFIPKAASRAISALPRCAPCSVIKPQRYRRIRRFHLLWLRLRRPAHKGGHECRLRNSNDGTNANTSTIITDYRYCVSMPGHRSTDMHHGTLSSLGNDARGCHRGWLCEVRAVVQNNAPRLELSGPGSLWLNETGTWTVKATDSDRDNVSVSMFFGDESAIDTSTRNCPSDIVESIYSNTRRWRDGFVSDTSRGFGHTQQHRGYYVCG